MISEAILNYRKTQWVLIHYYMSSNTIFGSRVQSRQFKWTDNYFWNVKLLSSGKSITIRVHIFASFWTECSTSCFCSYPFAFTLISSWLTVTATSKIIFGSILWGQKHKLWKENDFSSPFSQTYSQIKKESILRSFPVASTPYKPSQNRSLSWPSHVHIINLVLFPIRDCITSKKNSTIPTKKKQKPKDTSHTRFILYVKDARITANCNDMQNYDVISLKKNPHRTQFREFNKPAKISVFPPHLNKNFNSLHLL